MTWIDNLRRVYYYSKLDKVFTEERKEHCRSWFEQTISISKAFTYIAVGFYFTSILWQALFYDFMLNSWAILFYHEWYRIFTSQYVCESLFQLIVILPLFLVEFEHFVKEWGLIVALLDLVWINFFVNISFVQLELSFFFETPPYFFLIWGNSGFWISTLVYIINRYYKEPDGYTEYYLLQRPIKNLHYLGLFILVSIILHYGLPVVTIFGILVGIVHNNVFDNKVYEYLQSYFSRYENSMQFIRKGSNMSDEVEIASENLGEGA